MGKKIGVPHHDKALDDYLSSLKVKVDNIAQNIYIEEKKRIKEVEFLKS